MKIRSFFRNTRGSIVPTFALAIIPVMGFVGAAVDYSRANSVKVALQSALDATTLAIAKDAPTLSASALQQKAVANFQAQFDHPEAKNVTLTTSYTSTGGSTLTMTASASIDTAFMRIIGYSSLAIGSSSTVTWGSQRLRVALVLDTTGSMNDAGKIGALKTATKNLITQLQGVSSTNGDVLVSIIPFSKNVNVGASNYNGTWIDWTDWEAEPASIKNNKPSNWSSVGPGDLCPFSTSTHGFRCVTTPTGSTNTSYIPSSGTYSGYICPGSDTGNVDAKKIGIQYNGCYNSVSRTRTISTGRYASCGSTPDCTCSGSGSNRVCSQQYYEHNWIVNAHSTWQGCVTDRGTSAGPSGDYDRKIAAPSTGVTASLFPAEQSDYCSPALSQLSYNWSAMKTMVDGFYAAGATNQPIGLVWGWQSLVGGGPIAAPPAKEAGYNYSEVIVLMSDGLNTLNRWSGNGSSTSTAVDLRMYESATLGTCANIKAAGITIYTIHVNTDGDPTSQLLKNCASSTDKFYTVTSASGIGTVFNQIGTQLSKLRISK